MLEHIEAPNREYSRKEKKSRQNKHYSKDSSITRQTLTRNSQEKKNRKQERPRNTWGRGIMKVPTDKEYTCREVEDKFQELGQSSRE